VLRHLGAPSLPAVNSAARRFEIFSNLRAQRLDLSQLAVLEPQLWWTNLAITLSGAPTGLDLSWRSAVANRAHVTLPSARSRRHDLGAIPD
jgi:hypothetical protein